MQGFIEFFRLSSSRLGHVGPATAPTADNTGNFRDPVPRMDTAVDKVFTMEPTGPGLAARRKGLAGEAMGRPKTEEEAAK